jgi:hypothetical protein
MSNKTLHLLIDKYSPIIRDCDYPAEPSPFVKDCLARWIGFGEDGITIVVDDSMIYTGFELVTCFGENIYGHINERDHPRPIVEDWMRVRTVESVSIGTEDDGAKQWLARWGRR